MSKGEIPSIIEGENIKTYFIKHLDGKTYILLYLPYNPYTKAGQGYAYINAFYPASNTLFFISKRINEQLSKYNASTYKGNLKKLFVDAKCAVYLKNSLVLIEPYGTRVALAAIECDLIDTPEVLSRKRINDIACSHCNACEKACPTGAIQGFYIDKEKCLRYACDHIDETELDLMLMDKSILGCDVCQAACPYNAKIKTVPMPERLQELLEIDTLIKNAEGGRNELKELAGYIGDNYNRPGRILRLALLAKELDKDSFLK
ncbi:MAG TPA: 4Fe-4S double cluster binding domain-containing protein [Clostridia bacterium]|jgi:ferredoxin|nr:4Fe-4S double cluster binding domain-containing protein [Clostridia bacterium]